MRILYIVDAFPVITETFILNQITGMIQKGHLIRILARHHSATRNFHPYIEDYALLDKTFYFNNLPKRRFRRLLTLVAQCAKFFVRDPLRTMAALARILPERLGENDFRFNLLDSFYINEIVTRHNIDIIHCQFGTAGPVIAAYRHIFSSNVKLVTSFRGHDATQDHRTNQGQYNFLFATGDLFLPVSAALQDKIVALGCPRQKTEVLHSGIDCNFYSYHERKPQHDTPIKLLSIARFVEMKGLIYSIEASKILADKGYKFHYTIIGDGTLRAAIEQRIADLGLDAYITLAGWRSQTEILDYLHNSHVFVCPSVTAENGEMEGIPNAAKEAMAVGMPVVATNHGGLVELIQDGVSGFIVAERDSAALAEKVGILVDHPELWMDITHNARNHILSNFDITLLNDKVEQLYSHLLSR